MKKTIILTVCLGIGLTSVSAQEAMPQTPEQNISKPDTVYLDIWGKKTKSEESAVKYQITTNNPEVTNGKIQRTYYKNHQLQSEQYLRLEPQKDMPNKTTKIREGIYREWHENGTPKLKATYSNNKYNGVFETYWKNGQKRRLDTYTDGKWLEGTCYDSTGLVVTYYPFEQMPQYPGGVEKLLEFIRRHTHYPETELGNRVQGKVLIRFTVTKEGKVDKVETIRSLSPELDAEAQRVVNMLPDWIPGKQEGETVDVYYTLPITFKIEHSRLKESTIPFYIRNVRGF